MFINRQKQRVSIRRALSVMRSWKQAAFLMVDLLNVSTSSVRCRYYEIKDCEYDDGYECDGSCNRRA